LDGLSKKGGPVSQAGNEGLPRVQRKTTFGGGKVCCFSTVAFIFSQLAQFFDFRVKYEKWGDFVQRVV
jgi:hypothetical protein